MYAPRSQENHAQHASYSALYMLWLYTFSCCDNSQHAQHIVQTATPLAMSDDSPTIMVLPPHSNAEILSQHKKLLDHE
jgi:hypothetical protein